MIRGRVVLVPAGGSWDGEPLPRTISPEDWEINTVDNVAKSHMGSLEFSFARELSFLPGPLSRVRINANYTRMRYDEYENYYRPTNVANLSCISPIVISACSGIRIGARVTGPKPSRRAMGGRITTARA